MTVLDKTKSCGVADEKILKMIQKKDEKIRKLMEMLNSVLPLDQKLDLEQMIFHVDKKPDTGWKPSGFHYHLFWSYPITKNTCYDYESYIQGKSSCHVVFTTKIHIHGDGVSNAGLKDFTVEMVERDPWKEEGNRKTLSFDSFADRQGNRLQMTPHDLVEMFKAIEEMKEYERLYALAENILDNL